MPISSKLPLKKINIVHNLITFSIVFTNKMGGGGRFDPPPQKKLGVKNTPSKLRLMFLSLFFVFIPDLNVEMVYQQTPSTIY